MSLRLVLPYGAETDPPGKAGLADLTAEMLTLGTRRLTAAQIAAEVEFRGMKVPEVLLSGHHAEIARWRAEQARHRTRVRRPDLLNEAGESPET